MLLPISIHNITVRHVELIDHMNLICFIIPASLRNSKSTSDLSQSLHHAFFFFKSRRRDRTLSGYPGTVSSLPSGNYQSVMMTAVWLQCTLLNCSALPLWNYISFPVAIFFIYLFAAAIN